jgi:hypothetical protein
MASRPAAETLPNSPPLRSRTGSRLLRENKGSRHVAGPCKELTSPDGSGASTKHDPAKTHPEFLYRREFSARAAVHNGAGGRLSSQAWF